MVVLAVDYGDTRTGLAKCDRENILASPLCVITERNSEKLLERIKTEAQSIGAELIVVGNPLNMDGSSGERSKRCKDIAEKLTFITGLETVLWDERQSTVSAAYYLNQTNVRGKKRKGVIDAVAAVIILESYLSYCRNAKRGDVNANQE
ncbi:MAG: Holliday junction resolvase RuvX [Ruminococcus sp.]|nr:Holliday junction resolvase RuvX [Ruminococcus sp.]